MGRSSVERPSLYRESRLTGYNKTLLHWKRVFCTIAFCRTYCGRRCSCICCKRQFCGHLLASVYVCTCCWRKAACVTSTNVPIDDRKLRNICFMPETTWQAMHMRVFFSYRHYVRSNTKLYVCMRAQHREKVTSCSDGAMAPVAQQRGFIQVVG